jgi:hypothetical protein
MASLSTRRVLSSEVDLVRHQFLADDRYTFSSIRTEPFGAAAKECKSLGIRLMLRTWTQGPDSATSSSLTNAKSASELGKFVACRQIEFGGLGLCLCLLELMRRCVSLR